MFNKNIVTRGLFLGLGLSLAGFLTPNTAKAATLDLNTNTSIVASDNNSGDNSDNTNSKPLSNTTTATVLYNTSRMTTKVTNVSNMSLHDVLHDSAAEKRLAEKTEQAKKNLELKAKADAEKEAKLKAKAEEEARLKAEAEAKAKAEEEARLKAEEEARIAAQKKAEEEAAAKAKAAAAKGPAAKITFSENSLDYLARCVYHEAGNQDELGKRLVIDVILNRIDQLGYTSIEDVINAPGQFEVVSNGSITDGTVVKPEIRKMIDEEIKNRTNADVLYFRTNHFHDFAKPLFQHGDHYFSGR